MNILLLPILTISIYMLMLFILAILKKDNSIVDIGYGIGFIVIALVTFLAQDITPSHRSILISLYVVIWGTRLAYRIARKNLGKPEDFRYAAWRAEWQKKGEGYFVIRSFVQIFLLQGIIILMVALPIILGNTMQVDTLKWYNYVGIFLWIFGFLFEAIGDAQLDKFLKRKRNKTEKSNIMKTGLWKYTRHPNYFGESIQWWGLALLCLFGVKYSLVAFVSPILITYLLLFVSGIPLLEKRWEGDPEWQEYKKKTNAFIPGPQK